MRILITKPESPGKQGGMTVALNQVITYLNKNEKYQISCFEYISNNQYLISRVNSPTGKSSFKSIRDALNFSNPTLVIGVGWHTWSEKAIRVAKQKRCKTIFWSHGVGASTWYASKPLLSLARIVLRTHQLFQLIKTLLHTDHLVTAYKRHRWQDTRSIDEAIAKWLNVRNTVIPNAVDSALWSPLGKLSHRRPWVVSVGRMEWQKGMKKAFEIVQKTNQFTNDNCKLQWLVMHPGQEKINEEFRAIQSLNGKQKNEVDIIEKTGLNIKERRNILNQALCLLCWSDTEYQSLSILEALSCGCPVISRPVGWLRHQSVQGLMVAENQEQAAACIMQLASDQPLQQKMADAARQGIIDNHRIKAIAEQWEVIIEEMTIK